MPEYAGNLDKMRVQLHEPVEYQLPLGDFYLPMNPLIGQSLRLHFSGTIHCTHCNRAIKKSFNQGYCYPCFRALAQCDSCIVKPELCHYAQGTCREPQWGEANCMIPHVVYLANSSGLNVGITRHSQIPTRWIDQGATQAVPIFRVQTRYQSGLVENALRAFVNDRTDWRAMLKGDAEPLDLEQERDRLLTQAAEALDAIRRDVGDEAIQAVNEPVQTLRYPVTEYLKKISSFDLDKTPEVQGSLLGIKGQYLIFDTGVINIRKYTGYQIAVSH